MTKRERIVDIVWRYHEAKHVHWPGVIRALNIAGFEAAPSNWYRPDLDRIVIAVRYSRRWLAFYALEDGTLFDCVVSESDIHLGVGL